MAHETEYTKIKECEVKALPMEEKKRLVAEHKAHWFFPRHMVEQGLQCLLVVMLMVTLATLVPAHLGPKADPFDTPAHIKPEWYFLAAFYSLKLAEYTEFLGSWAPKIIGIAGQGVAVGVLFMVPWLDRGDVKVRNWRKRPKAMIGLALGLGGFIVLTLMGHFS